MKRAIKWKREKRKPAKRKAAKRKKLVTIHPSSTVTVKVSPKAKAEYDLKKRTA